MPTYKEKPKYSADSSIRTRSISCALAHAGHVAKLTITIDIIVPIAPPRVTGPQQREAIAL